MKFVNRYKGYKKTTIVFERFPLRILRFKRPKWKRIQKLIVYNRESRVMKKQVREKLLSRPRSRPFDPFVKYLDPYTWYKLRNYYANVRKARSSILKLFDGISVAKSFKRCLKRKKKSFQVDDSYLKMIVRPGYKLGILIWRLSFFISSYLICQAMNNKKVYLRFKSRVIKFIKRAVNALLVNALFIAFAHMIQGVFWIIVGIGVYGVGLILTQPDGYERVLILLNHLFG